MIIKNKYFQVIGLTVTLVLFFIVGLVSIRIENSTCMGVKIISAHEYEELLHKKTDEFDVDFLFNQTAAATDSKNNVIYISQNITEQTKLTDIQGILSTENPNYQLVIKKDDNFDNLFDVMTSGSSCSLLAVAPSGDCVEYQIVFTSLPLINIRGDIIAATADNGTDLYMGEISFFDPDSEETESYRTVSSDVQWHIRGNTTAKQPKKPWKLSLKDQNGENKNLSFCGLGADDDWILNPMNLDDLKIREKLMMDLWNSDEVFTNQDILMSQGEYVEVILNGEYYGLYLLQRRLDKKYLGMGDEDILLKSKTTSTKSYVSSETMEIVYSPFTDEATVSYLENCFDGKYIPFTNISNWIDMTVYTQMTCSVDNRQSKNIVMMLDFDENNNYTVNYILWDTDMSFGLWWSAGYVYDFDRTVFADVVRCEYAELSETYPSLDTSIASRWFEMRKTLFSDENIAETIDKLYKTITHSGSLQRDYDRWGLYYGGVDSMEQLNLFIKTRLDYLDSYYAA